MKFIHMADMHFDAPFTVLNTRSNLGEKRRLEQREVFKKIITYIKENNIEYLFIAGDFYEHNYIRKSTIEYVNDLFKQIPQTKKEITNVFEFITNLLKVDNIYIKCIEKCPEKKVHLVLFVNFILFIHGHFRYRFGFLIL